jgi:hypothetical protein
LRPARRPAGLLHYMKTRHSINNIRWLIILSHCSRKPLNSRHELSLPGSTLPPESTPPILHQIHFFPQTKHTNDNYTPLRTPSIPIVSHRQSTGPRKCTYPFPILDKLCHHKTTHTETLSLTHTQTHTATKPRHATHTATAVSNTQKTHTAQTHTTNRVTSLAGEFCVADRNQLPKWGL